MSEPVPNAETPAPESQAAPAPQEAPPPQQPTQPAVLPGPSRIGVISLGVAIGLTSAFIVFILGIMAGLFGWGVVAVQVLASLYIGYEPSFVGSIAGAVWAFVDGFFVGVMIGWLYNRVLLMRR